MLVQMKCDISLPHRMPVLSPIAEGYDSLVTPLFSSLKIDYCYANLPLIHPAITVYLATHCRSDSLSIRMWDKHRKKLNKTTSHTHKYFINSVVTASNF